MERGETLTVWMRVNNDDEHYRCVQVELRVTEDGKAEIYCDDAIVMEFKDWYKFD